MERWCKIVTPVFRCGFHKCVVCKPQLLHKDKEWLFHRLDPTQELIWGDRRVSVESASVLSSMKGHPKPPLAQANHFSSAPHCV